MNSNDSINHNAIESEFATQPETNSALITATITSSELSSSMKHKHGSTKKMSILGMVSL